MCDENLPAEEASRRAHKLYEQEIKPNLEARGTHVGEYIAVDVDSGDYETALRALKATRAVKERNPNATIHLMRIGSEGAKAAYKFGGVASPDLLR